MESIIPHRREVKGMEKRYTIGVLIGNANSPHTMDLMKGIYHAAEKMNVNLLYFLGIHSNYSYRAYFGDNAEDDYDYQFNIVYDYTGLGKVDALIISYGSLSIFLEEKSQEAFLQRFEGIPYVLLEDRDESGRGTSIIADNYNGMYAVAEHLVRDHGYRDFTFLAGPEGNTDAAERKAAFLDVLEKYQIPFEADRIEYGDYSACVEVQINRLLDRYPRMEAMVCANDVMADTVYRECEKRGLMVGHDIAVTGYDDWEVAKAMNPPLTTVLQNAYDMGYMAVIGAVELCKGKRPHSIIVPAHVKFRESCGCHAARREIFSMPQKGNSVRWEEHLEETLKVILERILVANTNEDIRKVVENRMRQLLWYDILEEESREQILFQLKILLDEAAEKYIFPNVLLKELNSYIDAWIEELMEDRENYRRTVPGLIELKECIQDTIQGHMVKHSNEKYATYQQETWFLPLISRDMMNHIDDEKEFYRRAMVKLSALKAKNSYLYLFKEPVVHPRHEQWKRPKEMYFAAYQEGDNIRAFYGDEMPVLSEEKGIPDYYSGDNAFSMCVFCLFSGEKQYGILVTEIDPADFSLSYLISMQIGNALKFHDLSMQQRGTQRKLEKLVKEINEKNEILNFISEYDALTGCLNRRGFMEQAVELNKLNAGREAMLIFADLDHLKEINDCFGHMEGDFAIRRCAEVLKELVKDSGVVGRIGGDEFAAIILHDGRQCSEKILEGIREANKSFNEVSDKPYYVEMSAGSQQFLCGEEVVITDVLKKADLELYQQKKMRRKTICKNRDKE